MNRHNHNRILSIVFILSFINCENRWSDENLFISQYEFEDFSQFKGSSIFIRGVDLEKNPVVFINAPHLLNDTLRTGMYAVTIDKNSHNVIMSKWLTNYFNQADTLKLQKLAQKFISYKISGLIVDTNENTFVYLENIQHLSLAKIIKDTNTQDLCKGKRWVKLKKYWYGFEE